MHLIVGLGNPGREYEGNRHNAGFVVLDALRGREGLADYREKFDGVWTRGEAFGKPVALLKPMTFMNLSGDSVQPAAAFLKVPPSNIVVVHDELDLAWRDVRVKVGGGHAGHNGLRSLIQRLGTPDFVRVRVGVGKPGPGFKGDIAAWVLSNFDAMERAEWGDVEGGAIAALRTLLESGPAAAMNTTNRALKAQAKTAKSDEHDKSRDKKSPGEPGR